MQIVTWTFYTFRGRSCKCKACYRCRWSVLHGYNFFSFVFKLLLTMYTHAVLHSNCTDATKLLGPTIINTRKPIDWSKREKIDLWTFHLHLYNYILIQRWNNAYFIQFSSLSLSNFFNLSIYLSIYIYIWSIFICIGDIRKAIKDAKSTITSFS